jgi:predicted nucleotidyltransferase
MKVASLEAILRALNDSQVRYLIVGGLAVAANREKWIREKNMVVFQLHSEAHRETRIDLFVTEPFDFDEEYLHATLGELLAGLAARFARMETLVAMKNKAGRPKDLEDVRQLRRLMEHSENDE